MRWLNLLFMHWPVPADRLRSLVPRELEIDEHGGSAWVGLVPFAMRDVCHGFPPGFPGVPTARHFLECNVRTYVRDREGNAGVWFFSLDATSRLAVFGARRFWGLPYFHARISQRRDGSVIEYSVDRIHRPRALMRCSWRVGRPLPRTKPGELAHFLTERYSMFTPPRHRSQPGVQRGRIWHKPWPLHEAELLSLDDELVAAAGIDLAGASPVTLHHAEQLDVEAWRLECC